METPAGRTGRCRLFGLFSESVGQIALLVACAHDFSNGDCADCHYSSNTCFFRASEKKSDYLKHVHPFQGFLVISIVLPTYPLHDGTMKMGIYHRVLFCARKIPRTASCPGGLPVFYVVRTTFLNYDSNLVLVPR